MFPTCMGKLSHMHLLDGPDLCCTPFDHLTRQGCGYHVDVAWVFLSHGLGMARYVLLDF